MRERKSKRIYDIRASNKNSFFFFLNQLLHLHGMRYLHPRHLYRIHQKVSIKLQNSWHSKPWFYLFILYNHSPLSYLFIYLF